VTADRPAAHAAQVSRRRVTTWIPPVVVTGSVSGSVTGGLSAVLGVGEVGGC